MAKYEEWRTKDGLLKISGWARDGLTDRDISHNMGIGLSTLSLWKTKYMDIVDALKNSKDIADRTVENSLYRRANGYSYQESKTVVNQILNNQGQIIEVERTEVYNKHMPADPTSMIYWLKNRKPNEWRERRTENDEVIGDGMKKVDELLSGIDKLAKG